ncbi:MAG: tetratricopeptide repeat protein [Thermodesulfobacteriota bacterium]
MKRVPFLWFFLSGLCLSVLLLQGPKVSAAELPKDQLKTFLLSGVEKALNLDEQGAMAELRKAIELDRENPIGFSFLAMNHLFFYETSFSEKEKKTEEAALVKAVEDARTRAEKRIEKNPQDGGAYFSLALEAMVKDRWEMDRKNYFRAFREAQRVWDYLEKIRELDPGNYDVYYPMGILHYYLAQLSGVARGIASVFITSADREKGLKELELAAEKGYFLKDMAQSNLVSIYYLIEKQPERALPLAKQLREKYPRNYNFCFALADTLSRLGRFEEAMAAAREIETGIKSGIPPYRPELWPRYQQLLGKIFLDQGDYEKATEYLKLALKDQAPYNARVRAWALVRLGMIQDARKERKLAEDYYQKALEVEGAEGGAQRAAKEYLETPYSPPTMKEKKP